MFWTAVSWMLTSWLAGYFLMMLLLLPTVKFDLWIAERAEQGPPTTGDRIVFWLWLVFNLAYSYYLMTAWAAWCAYGGLAFALDPGTSDRWFYYLLAVFTCAGLVGGMASKEGDNVGFGTCSSSLLAVLSCILFMIFPTWISPLHWWWLKYVASLYG